MTHASGRLGGRVLSRTVTAAIAATLVAGTAGTALADGGAPQAAVVQDARSLAAAPGVAAAAPTASAPALAVFGADGKSYLHTYALNGKGGFKPVLKDKKPGGWKNYKAVSQAHDVLGGNSGFYFLNNKNEAIFADRFGPVRLGKNWQYDTFFSPGNLGGAKTSDLVVRDKAGVLWIYQGKADGSVEGRKKVGGGWGQFTQIAGRGDLTGDGKTDLVARDKQGTLWLYKGTGNINKPFEGRTKVSGGWNKYNLLVSTGDVDLDGHSDLLARDKGGVMWLYKGTGKQAAPFKAPVKVGSGFNQYRLVF
ncbi:VCBS repeat-containing protein [Streptomyces sp. I05A-00742]|uniref:FG-GAP repeat domain-containing protein n=1 Tax=Streptomyces sp. I05A-00742 TaxID=2732853 RepID=UPI001488E74A|nr:VCBS repeat-containing protein [Streptomyces sp. I05A-00742]